MDPLAARIIGAVTVCGVMVLDAQHRLLAINETARSILGLDAVLPDTEAERIFFDVVDAINAAIPRASHPVSVAAQTGQPQRAIGLNVTRLDGQRRRLLVDAIPVPEGDGVPATVVVSFVDVTEQGSAIEALSRSEAQTRAILELALDAILTVDHQGRVTEFNPAAERMFGYRRDEALGQPVSVLIVPPSRRARHDDVRETYMRTGEAAQVGRWVQGQAMRRDGSEFPVEVATIPIPGVDPPAFVGYMRDISERREIEEMLRRQALHDALTGLPNRMLLYDRIDYSCQTMQRDGHPLALLVFDLDRFKEVNDTHGHRMGDMLLEQVARRLEGILRASDTVARLGGDEFAVLLPGDGADGAVDVADRIVEILGEPFAIDGHTLHIGASIGIALGPTHGTDAATLLHCADMAMYTAKRGTRGHVLFVPDAPLPASASPGD